jgi:hypothetical protein
VNTELTTTQIEITKRTVESLLLQAVDASDIRAARLALSEALEGIRVIRARGARRRIAGVLAELEQTVLACRAQCGGKGWL